MVTVASAWMTRSRPLASITVASRPAPLIVVTPSTTSRSRRSVRKKPEASGPGFWVSSYRPALSWTTSSPVPVGQPPLGALLFAASTASRSEHLPLEEASNSSAVVVTAIVLAEAPAGSAKSTPQATIEKKAAVRPTAGDPSKPSAGDKRRIGVSSAGPRTIWVVQRNRNGRAAESSDANGAGVVNPRARQRALAVGVFGEVHAGIDPLVELKELLRTAGVATAGELIQRRDRPDPDRYLGRGKIAELKHEVKVADANLVAIDDELAPRQERNLEAELGVPVIDRTAVILDIFADHAHSAEGKLQVELAQLEYNLTRMRGLWTHLERLGAGRIDGGIGTRGPGESQIETDRRLARDRITALKRRLERLEQNRGVMRARRERRACPRSRWPATPTPASRRC